jgi:serine protease AprX
MFDSVETHQHTHEQNRFAVMPTATKLSADERFTGRGVRIAFLDSGYYPHPDLVNRVVAFHDISGEEKSLSQVFTPAPHHWHGTQTVTACAGDGHLSNGTYRGLAYRSELVLVKVSRQGQIGDGEIEAGLLWVIGNHEKYDIRILNISLGGDCDLKSEESQINALIEKIVSEGVVVTVAAGNSSEMHSWPPASAPSAITVGGYSDANRLAAGDAELYHSSFGRTADNLVKPEIIAPAMYVAAPILPGTRDNEVAETLSMLVTAPIYSFRSLLDEFWRDAGLNDEILDSNDAAARQIIDNEIDRRKIITTHYQHVDGTSFAAPITASVVAQMLEANPSLTPAAVKNILLSTASRLKGQPAIRQGFGIINAMAAVELAEREQHVLSYDQLHTPRVVGPSIVFSYHDDAAVSVDLVGDFNNWRVGSASFETCDDGIWRTSIPCQPAGEYRYKFVINGHRWVEDPAHGFKEEDGYGGFNSLLIISDN